MPEAPLELDELVDLKMLPAWVNKPSSGERFADHAGEDRSERRGRDRRPRDRGRPDRRGPRREFDRPASKEKRPERPDRPPGGERRPPRGRDRNRQSNAGAARTSDHRKDRHHHHRPLPPMAEKPLPLIVVRFSPRATALENVVEQIKSSSVAYSLFALARLFLEKATRHDVKLTPPAETPLFQLGESGAVSTDRQFLERTAFRAAQNDFYKVEVTETEPIKGNFSNVARDRLSGTVLGPTNHHDYQRRLRSLYEQRFSRRMNFPEFQRKIEIVSDPTVVEKWKEDARKVTTYSTVREEPSQTFSSVNEAERHFEKNYLPGLVRTVSEMVIDGPASRQMHDRVLARVVENEWNRENKSPSPMMQELAARFREASLHVFRHRRGMLFVSSIYPRAFTAEQTAVSSQVRTIVEAIAAQPRIGRKELADKLIVDLSGEDAERAKLALASDLIWLISSGHVIEFNDGSLDLPRAKVKKEAPAPTEQKENAEADATAKEKEARVEAGAPPAEETETPEKSEDVVAAVVSTAELDKQALGTSASTTEESEIGGS